MNLNKEMCHKFQENDLFDTVSKFDEFRLRNLATAQTASEHPQDRLVIEMLPLDDKTVDGFDIIRTSYGIKIDRHSNVTIIAPSSALENTIGHVAYYLAQFGGFNYISREFVTDVDEPVSYYTILGTEDKWEESLKDFISDVSQMSSDKSKWNIALISSDNIHDSQIHFVHQANGKNGLLPTTLEEERFQNLFNDLSEKMSDSFGLLSDLDEKYRPVGKKNIGVMAGGGTTNNSFSLRISYSVTTWSDRWAPVVVEMAKIIKQHLEAEDRSEFTEQPSWKEQGCGYGENEQDNQ